MKKLWGRKIASEILVQLKKTIRDTGLRPGLGVLLVGDDPASEVYTLLKTRAAKDMGMKVERISLPASTSQQDVCAVIQQWNERLDIHGILVQLPLPETIDPDDVIRTIDPRKDVDGFHPDNVAAFQKNTSGLRSPLLMTVERFLEETHQDFTHQKAVILGKSDIFLSNMAMLLSRRGLEILDHSSSVPKPQILRQSDVVVTALGKPNVVNVSMLKSPVVLIDIGITRINKKIYGDVNPQALNTHQGFRTPVPGGVGPLTVAMVLSNVLTAAEKQSTSH